jgi:hypothetical protein
MNEVRIISSGEIDAVQWNGLVDRSVNGLIYAYSWYLDKMCERWVGMVYGDYEAVMPLPTNSKLGLKYAYQPAFVQQLGVICSNTTAADRYLNAFMPFLKKYYSYIDIKLNFLHTPHPRYNNYILSLDTTFSQIQSGFNRSFKEAFKQSKKTPGKLYFSNDLKEALAFNSALYDFRSVKLKEGIYDRFGELCTYLQKNQQCLIPTWMIDGKVVAQAIVLKDRKRYYLMTSACLEEGRALRANHALMYYLLEALSGQEMFFDFEGSNIPGVAKFYESMGGQLETYPPLQCNFLPKWLRWIKQ